MLKYEKSPKTKVHLVLCKTSKASAVPPTPSIKKGILMIRRVVRLKGAICVYATSRYACLSVDSISVVAFIRPRQVEIHLHHKTWMTPSMTGLEGQ